jgi:hypothetical protein
VSVARAAGGGNGPEFQLLTSKVDHNPNCNSCPVSDALSRCQVTETLAELSTRNNVVGSILSIFNPERSGIDTTMSRLSLKGA